MLNKHDLKYKNYLKIQKRHEEVQKILNKIPLVKLEEPYQSGWYIKYELRDDIKRRADAKILKQVLEIGYHSHWITHNVHIVKRVRKGEKGHTSKRGHFYDYRPGRKELWERQYENMPEQLKSYFNFDPYHEIYVKHKRKLYKSYLPEHYLVLKARPHIITHTRRRGHELEREESYLYDLMRDYWITSTPGYGGSYPRHKDRRNTRDDIQKFIKGELDDLYNHKVPREYDH